MRRVTALILPALVLAACSGDNKAIAASGPCGPLQPVFDSRTNAVPFETVRKAKFKLGEVELDDKVTTGITLGDNLCTTSVMEGFFGQDANIYIFNCPVFQAGTLDREANEARAMEAFSRVEAMVTSCLGPDFIAETSEESTDLEVFRKTIWDFVDPPEIAAGSFRADPAYLELSYSPFMRGRSGPSGWLVELQLQEQRATE
ncbi:hypothetical protein [Aquisalinus flavus]|uniref:Lipoprotein n=1 Tax=Aquisalinus flavus TaxID=1526572 RepID=A0A8J2Y7I3_9PROT|nr:hypothetical protein [Aquisalinus flavus]MBD0425562.1 hypothetical protein [Aquisalinus flavus]UNE48813.1 hypothetical protein FF099_12515 [Aquisalinus flavus]GGD15057.1 hypothetical protein GCM10011342_24810 [Aquisalinus flavus]